MIGSSETTIYEIIAALVTLMLAFIAYMIYTAEEDDDDAT
jgi:hypothetical protein